MKSKKNNIINLFKNKIYDNSDIFYYILNFLNFSDKLSLSKSININLIKNYNLIDNKFNKKTLLDINCICDNCYCELTSEQSMSLSSKYDNFLYYNLSDSENDSSDDSVYRETENIVNIINMFNKNKDEII